jgi:hypothetical protein
VETARVPSPKAAAPMKHHAKRNRDCMPGSCPSINVRKIAPAVAKSNDGCLIARPKIVGAMTKAAAVSPIVRPNLDLSRRMISLNNRRPLEDIINQSTYPMQ